RSMTVAFIVFSAPISAEKHSNRQGRPELWINVAIMWGLRFFIYPRHPFRAFVQFPLDFFRFPIGMHHFYPAPAAAAGRKLAIGIIQFTGAQHLFSLMLAFIEVGGHLFESE